VGGCRLWISGRSSLRAGGVNGPVLEELGSSMLATLLAALQRIPGLLNGSARSDARVALRTALVQVDQHPCFTCTILDFAGTSM
jgi:hypothetical protein